MKSILLLPVMLLLAACTTTTGGGIDVGDIQGEVCERAPSIKEQVAKALAALDALCPTKLLAPTEAQVTPAQPE